eukprot:Gb_40113 [translate_table: standard]
MAWRLLIRRPGRLRASADSFLSGNASGMILFQSTSTIFVFLQMNRDRIEQVRSMYRFSNKTKIVQWTQTVFHEQIHVCMFGFENGTEGEGEEVHCHNIMLLLGSRSGLMASSRICQSQAQSPLSHHSCPAYRDSGHRLNALGVIICTHNMFANSYKKLYPEVAVGFKRHGSWLSIKQRAVERIQILGLLPLCPTLGKKEESA